ncbi:MAG: hypothetical protein ISR98_00695 [Parcubacteria group bacterium]|nr:hypothetical protein [Parcubacteria group bacterium]
MSEKILKTVKASGESVGIPVLGFFLGFLVVLFYILLRMAPELLAEIFFTLRVFAPVWVPLFLLYFFWFFWVLYVRAKFFKNQEYVVLEVKLPREILKSPLAMESVFMGIHQGVGESTWFDKYWLGKTRTSFSFEIVSIEGEIKFFIWTRAFWRDVVEAQIYAQYPEVEVVEADDYTRMIKYDINEIAVWGADFKLRKPDPYPIKTYVDYGLDKDPKEEYKVDPMAPMLEHFGSLGKGEQLWLQLIIRVNKNEKKKKGTWFGKTGWQKEGEELINKLMLRDEKTKSAKELSAAGFPINPSLSKGEQEIISAIERSISKLAFDVGMRGLYIAEKDKFRSINIMGLLGATKQFNSNTLNEFGPTRYSTILSYPWEDYKKIRKNRAGRRVFDAYRRRSYFHHPYKTPPFVLNTEELATVYHFPGSNVKTPTISRVPSKKSEAPSDLPI